MPRRKCSHERRPPVRLAAHREVSPEISRSRTPAPVITEGAGDSRRRHLALPDPGHRGLERLYRRFVLAVTPVTARALLVMLGPAGRADHGAIIGSFPPDVCKRAR